MKGLQIQIYFFLIILFAALVISSCSTTKYVPDDEYLLNKVRIKTDIKEYNSSDLTPYVKQVPNSKMFWLLRSQLLIYSASGRDTTRWINRKLRKMGEPPVIFDSTLVYRTGNELTKFFVNKGYINVDVESKIVKKNKKAEVTYIITTNKPYHVRNYETNIPDSAIYKDLYKDGGSQQRLSGEPAALRTPLVSKGMLFDRNVLNKERERITRLLRNRGYYAFEKNYITYDADSSLNVNAVDLMMRLHLYPEFLPIGIFAEVPHRKYYINKVFIYTDYDPLRAVNEGENYMVRDSVVRGNHTVYFPGKSSSIRPSVLIAHNYMSPGRPYSQTREEITYSAYSGLSAISSVQLRFEETLRNDTSFLNCHILTTPTRKQSFSYSVEGTNSAGDFGVASSIGYTHRNLFKGSEAFNIKLRGAYEAISEDFSQNYLDFGVETSIRFPKVLFPFLPYSFKRSMRASTELSFGYNYQTRPESDRRLVSGALKYIWQSRGAGEVKHQFNLIDVNYLFVPRISSDLTAKLEEIPEALLLYTDKFIVGSGYVYSRSTYNPFQKRRDAYSLRGSVESAGNTLLGICRLFQLPTNEDGHYELFGVPYAQYVKGDIDFSKTTFIDKHNSIAWRIAAGVAYSYGNETEIPFEKRYYSGGANSVRGWAVRTLGPGTYNESNSYDFYFKTGDIKLDLSLEYRSKLFWKLELATYVDAGNVWTIRNDWQSGSQFKFNSFYKEIAVSYGLGFRLDFDFFLVRFDTGFKAYNPEKNGKDCWTILHPNLKDNFAWHFAVGYPF